MQTRTWSLLIAVVWALGWAGVGLAAPASQVEDPAATETGTLAVWASSLYPAADSPGLLEVVALYPDNTAEVVSLYLGKGSVVETGTWEADSEGAVTVLLTGTQEGNSPEPVTLALTPTAEGLLDSGTFLFHKLEVVTPAELDARSAASKAAEGPEETRNEPVKPLVGDDFGSVWLSPVYPAADGAGYLTVLILYENGALEQASIYLTQGIIQEVGSWETEGLGSLTATVTGTLERVYSNAASTLYRQRGDSLVDGLFELASWPRVTPEALLAASDPSGTYVTNLYPAADAAGTVGLLTLYANHAAEQTTVYLGKGAVTEVGSWASQPDATLTVTLTGTLTVTLTGTLTGTLEEAYETAATTVYTRTEGGLQSGLFSFFRLTEITPAMLESMAADLAPAD